MEKWKKQLEILQLEIGNALAGESSYTVVDFTQAINMARKKANVSEESLSNLQEEQQKQKQWIDAIMPTFNEFKSWAEEFEASTMEQKKMIANQLFKRIELKGDMI